MLSHLSRCLFASANNSPNTAAATSGCRGDKVLRSGWRLLATCGVAAGPCVAAAAYVLGWGGDVTPMQLLLTGVILAASAIVASAAAARFWERHTAMQLLGIEAAPPDPRWTPAVALKPPFDYSKAAVDFAVGVFCGCTDVTYTGFAVCAMVLVAAASVEWKGRGAGDAAQISQQIAAYAFISFFEEVAFRSYLPLTLAYGLSTGDRFGFSSLAAIAASSVAWALYHALLNNASVAATVAITAYGLMFSLVKEWSSNVILIFGLHFAWNVCESVLFGLVNSGMSLSASVWVISANGPAWLTGSDFGVEAGLSGASGIIAATTTACMCNALNVCSAYATRPIYMVDS